MTRRVLLLGGLDPSGGAGITVDATVVALHGLEPLPIAVATTVQGRRGFRRAIAIDEHFVREQIATVLADGAVHAIKIGFLGQVSVLPAIAAELAPFADSVPIIVDPVLSATAGGFAEPVGLVSAYREHLLPLAYLVTPNTPELTALGGGDPAALLRSGSHAVLHKGGHGGGDDAVDDLYSGDQRHRFARRRLDIGPVRGTGCALASAIAARLARGDDLVAATRLGGDWLAALLARVQPRADGLPSHLPLCSVPPG